MRPVQYFTDEYLEQCRKMTPEQIVAFLEDFRTLQAAAVKPAKSRLISLKVPEPLLAAFKTKATLSQSACDGPFTDRSSIEEPPRPGEPHLAINQQAAQPFPTTVRMVPLD